MSNVSETDKFIVRSVNSGPMGPQGPVKKNVTIMNNESGIKYPARRYNLMNFMTEEEMKKTDLTDELLAGIPNDKMPKSESSESESGQGPTGSTTPMEVDPEEGSWDEDTTTPATTSGGVDPMHIIDDDI